MGHDPDRLNAQSPSRPGTPAGEASTNNAVVTIMITNVDEVPILQSKPERTAWLPMTIMREENSTDLFECGGCNWRTAATTDAAGVTYHGDGS